MATGESHKGERVRRIISHFRKAASHPLAKGSAIVFAGTMVANAGAYLYHLVVGRILGPAQYGELAALLSLSYILNVPSIVLQTVVTRFVAEHAAKKSYGDIRALVLRLTAFLLVAGALCLLGLIFAAPYIASFLHIKDTLVIFFLVTGIVVSMVGIVFSSVLQGTQRFTASVVITNMNSLLRLAAGAIAAWYGVAATLGANMAAAVVGTLMTLWIIRLVIRNTEKAKMTSLKPLFRSSVTTFLAILGISILNSQDVVVVKHFLPALQSGWYGALATMGKIIFFACYSFMFVLLPIVSDRSARGAKSGRLVYVSVAVVAVLSAGITLGFFLLPKLALGLLYGSAFIAAAPYLGLFGLFSSLYTISYTIVIALLGLGKFSVWMILIAAAIIQDVLLSYFHAGISSVIWVNIMVTATLVVALLLYYRHAVKEH